MIQDIVTIYTHILVLQQTFFFMANFEESSSSNEYSEHSTSITYNVIAIVIFCLVSYCFFLPCNKIIPLDRRSASVLGATLCYASRCIVFPHNKMDLVDAIDFDVLVLLGGIMAINFIMVCFMLRICMHFSTYS